MPRPRPLRGTIVWTLTTSIGLVVAVLGVRLRPMGRPGAQASTDPRSGDAALDASSDGVRHEAAHDELGLANRTMLAVRLDDAAELHLPTSVVVVDLDGLTAVDDRFGRRAGDAVLREVARRLRACTGAGDLVCRTGDDEITIVVAGDRFGADEVAQRALDAVAAPIRLPELAGQGDVRLGLSIGIAELGARIDPAETVHDAERAMHDAARTGGGIRHAVDADVPALRVLAGTARR